MGTIGFDPVTLKPVRPVRHVDTVPAFDRKSEDRKVRERAIEAGTVRRSYADWEQTNRRHKKDKVDLFLETFEVLDCGSTVEREGAIIDCKPFVGSTKAQNKRAAVLTKQHNHRLNRHGKVPDGKVEVLTREQWEARQAERAARRN